MIVLADNIVGHWDGTDWKALGPRKRSAHSRRAGTRENGSFIQWAKVDVRRAGQWAAGGKSSS